jgi:hypothetical protein
MFSISLQRADHLREYSICQREGAGWEVKVEEDRTPTRRAFYRDWHRVELALALFQREVAELVGDGWEVIHHSTESVGV